jgi:hypothetical protein
MDKAVVIEEEKKKVFAQLLACRIKSGLTGKKAKRLRNRPTIAFQTCLENGLPILRLTMFVGHI